MYRIKYLTVALLNFNSPVPYLAANELFEENKKIKSMAIFLNVIIK